MIRLQKFLADCGIASRRKCEELILAGFVKVNGEIITTMGKKVDEENDIVEYKGKEVVKKNNKKIYILLNKPVGYVTTVKDQFGRPTILDLIKEHNERLYPVGRLDMDTSGALIVSNDGDFVYRVTHPKHNIEKTYIATIKGGIDNIELEKLRNGIKIENYTTSPAKVQVLKRDIEKNQTSIKVIIHEGKNRQVRKMFETLGKKMKSLHRSDIGCININDVKSGEWRYLKESEIRNINGGMYEKIITNRNR